MIDQIRQKKIMKIFLSSLFHIQTKHSESFKINELTYKNRIFETKSIHNFIQTRMFYQNYANYVNSMRFNVYDDQ